jgi:hypothetical protein
MVFYKDIATELKRKETNGILAIQDTLGIVRSV